MADADASSHSTGGPTGLRASRAQWSEVTAEALDVLPPGRRPRAALWLAVAGRTSNQAADPRERGTAWWAKEMSCSRSTVKRARRDVERHGLVEVERRRDPDSTPEKPRHLVNRYHLRCRPGTLAGEKMRQRLANATNAAERNQARAAARGFTSPIVLEPPPVEHPWHCHRCGWSGRNGPCAACGSWLGSPRPPPPDQAPTT